jgi:hypothetical protein
MVEMKFVVGAVLAGAIGVAAQQPGFTRTVLQQVDLSVPGREAITARAEFQAGVPGGGTPTSVKRSAMSRTARWRSKSMA